MSLYVDIEKSVGSFRLKVKLEAENETLALLGASGCGKSMTLKCIAGIERPDRGRIVVDDVVLFDSEQRIDLTPQQRRVGLMFQNYALFPNMTVRQNIWAGAHRERDRRMRKRSVEAILHRFELSELAEHFPHQLSGGQQQRVALARILVSDPRILLLDEPFSALDSHLRFLLEREVSQAIQSFGKTVVLVSHDRDEVFRMSNRVALMVNGVSTVSGPKQEVFSSPQTKEGAILTGCSFFSRAKQRSQGGVYAEEWGMELSVPNVPQEIAWVGIRMQDVRFGSGENTFCCCVMEEIENLFTYTLLLRPENCLQGKPFGWSVDKAVWDEHRSDLVRIHIPGHAVLLLRE